VAILLLLLFVLYFAYITFYYTPNSSKKSVFCKLDMMRLLFCVMTNVLFFVCIICVYHVIINYCICVGSCLTIIFTFRYGIVHFKYFSGAIFCE